MTPHPLEETLARLAQASPDLQAWLMSAPGPEADWLTSAALMQPGTPHLAQALQRTAAHYKATDTQSPAALWFGQYSYAVIGVAIACYLGERRVPDLGPAGLWLRFDERGDPGGMALCNRAFFALPDDPAAGHPDCVVVPSQDALRARLRENLVAHLTPMIEAARAHSSLGKPAFWALAADYCASVFAWIGGMAGDKTAGLAEARLLADGPSPLKRKRDFVVIEHCDRTYPMLDRLSCCLYYKTGEGQYCSTCPHRPREERIQMIKNWMEREAAAAA